MPDQNTHDFTKTGWGWDYCLLKTTDEGLTWWASGWGKGIAAGDCLILRDGPLGTTRYRVGEIEYMRNPADQWFATIEFAPRLVHNGDDDDD